MASKKAGFSAKRFNKLWHVKKKVFGTFYQTTIRSGKKRKKVWKHVGKTRNGK